MTSETAQTASHRRLYEYLGETLRALPAEHSLSLRHPTNPRAHFHEGVTLPCDDNDDEGVGPHYFDVSYWIVGAAPNESDRHFELVVAGWQRLGWATRLDRDSRPRAAFTRTPDRYGLSIQQSIKGDLSVSASTPGFIRPAREPDPAPTTIPHPRASTTTRAR